MLRPENPVFLEGDTLGNSHTHEFLAVYLND